MQGNLSQKAERLTPTGKAQKPLFHRKQSVKEGMALGEDKQDGTFSGGACYGQRGKTMGIDWG
jgi:hypothetical protein